MFSQALSPDSEYVTKVERLIGENTDLTRDLENWMAKLPLSLRSLPIIYLAIPGSHDSFTSDISSASEISPDSEKILRDLRWIICVKVVMANWTKTQNLRVTNQLMAGIRYFDLRTSTKRGSSDLHFCHGLYSCKVEPVLKEIGTFLETHSGELIVIYRSDAARFGQPLLWPSASFPTPWADTMDPNTLFNYLDEAIANRTDQASLITQCILTPSLSDIIGNIFTSLKQKLAIDFEDQRTGWISKQIPGRKGVNIIIGDFVDLADNLFTKAVINLNLKLLSDLPRRLQSRTTMA
ncbi:PI-PLC X domain-containing protein 3-like isoform X2 [Euwallacea fornicatus]|uniref:PI-PLC X domain-containing protein 3-like isoform X2 n=1 Tax=Euwallacea fornicatus TaxID=995702 RepID=UPI00339025B5